MTKPRGPETLWTLTAEAEHLARLAKELHSQAESLAYDAADVGKKAGRLHDRLDCYGGSTTPPPTTATPPRPATRRCQRPASTRPTSTA